MWLFPKEMTSALCCPCNALSGVTSSRAEAAAASAQLALCWVPGLHVVFEETGEHLDPTGSTPSPSPSAPNPSVYLAAGHRQLTPRRGLPCLLSLPLLLLLQNLIYLCGEGPWNHSIGFRCYSEFRHDSEHPACSVRVLLNYVISAPHPFPCLSSFAINPEGQHLFLV
jgi:hypothetical protein